MWLDQPVALGLRQRQVLDRLARGADRRRLGERARQQAGGEARVEVEQARHDEGGAQAGARTSPTASATQRTPPPFIAWKKFGPTE